MTHLTLRCVACYQITLSRVSCHGPAVYEYLHVPRPMMQLQLKVIHSQSHLHDLLKGRIRALLANVLTTTHTNISWLMQAEIQQNWTCFARSQRAIRTVHCALRG